MKRVKLQKIVYTCFLSIPMILIIFFFLSYLVSKHHKLLSSTYEFIIVAKSSRVAVFAVVNVIVIAISLGSSKPSSAADFDVQFLSSPPVYEAFIEKEKEYNEGYDSSDGEEVDDYNEGYDSSDGEEVDDEPLGFGCDDGYDEDDDDDGLDEEDVDSEDESDTDLNMRIEEFIGNAYRKWREESLAERLLCLEPPS